MADSPPFVWFRGGGRRYSAPVIKVDDTTYKAVFNGMAGYYVATLHIHGRDAITATWGGNETLTLAPGDEVTFKVTIDG